MTKIRSIRNSDDLTCALARIDALWGAEQNTPDGDELDVLFSLVEHYESHAYPDRTMEPDELLLLHIRATGK